MLLEDDEFDISRPKLPEDVWRVAHSSQEPAVIYFSVDFTQKQYSKQNEGFLEKTQMA